MGFFFNFLNDQLKTVKLWNLLDGVCFKTIYVSETLSVMSVSIDKEFIACSCNQTVTVWKFEQNKQGYIAKKIREYKEHFKRFVASVCKEKLSFLNKIIFRQ
jgi:hypothetical protein